MNIDTILLYTLVSFFYIISPGPAVFLAINNGITYNMKAVSFSSLGNIVGLFLLSVISISGLGAILLSSSFLFTIVKTIGALYLIYLGIKQFINAKHQSLKTNKYVKEKKNLHIFTESFFIASTNPKPIIFFIAFFPQFLNLEIAILPQFLIMTFIFMFISFFSLLTYGYISKRTKRYFKNDKNISYFHKITGGIFIGMGLMLMRFNNSQN